MQSVIPSVESGKAVFYLQVYVLVFSRPLTSRRNLHDTYATPNAMNEWGQDLFLTDSEQAWQRVASRVLFH